MNAIRVSSLSPIKTIPVAIQLIQFRSAHYQINERGEKVVISKRNHIRSEKEKWQKVEAMGYEEELRQIKNIERNERLQANPKLARVTAEEKMQQLRDRLLNSGFCRDTKPYDPPNDINEKIDAICNDIFGANTSNIQLDNYEKKFKFLVRCSQEFNHQVGNSDLFRMKSIEDVRTFYNTPVRGTNSYDTMVQNSKNLPKNLHIIAEPIRYNQETDTFFDGINAYPGSTLESVGLRMKKKYPSFKNNFVWPDI